MLLWDIHFQHSSILLQHRALVYPRALRQYLSVMANSTLGSPYRFLPQDHLSSTQGSRLKDGLIYRASTEMTHLLLLTSME